jgi:pilus assembly protein TadC
VNIAGVLLAGAIVGLGIFLCVRELFPAPPALTAALDRFTPQGRRPASDAVPASTTTQVGRWLAARIAGTALDVRLPRRDLALLGKSIEGYLVQKVAMALFGLSVPTVLWTLLMPGVPWLVSTGSGLVYGVIMFLAPDLAVRSQAREAREEFRAALIAYLDLIKMARAAGAGPSEALESPARVCHGWAFQRIAGALDPASRGTRDPWDELARLAEEIGVRELADTATIARRAGTQGARILESLTAKAVSLREQQLARALTRAKSRTETMTVPVALSVLGYLILLGYPAYARIVGG